MGMPDSAISDVLYLVSCALGCNAPDSERVGRMDLGMVYRLAQRHLLTSPCATALERVGVRDERFVQARGKAIRKVALMDIERRELFRRMDETGIWHAPLKGCVLQDLYPEYGMRQMSDNDILFDPSHAEEVRKIMESMGFSCEFFDDGVHDVYHKKPVCNFELHRMLFSSAADPRVFDYYRDPTRLFVPDGEGGCGMRMRDEDFYVYLVAHEHKHFSAGGIGLRSLVDTFVFLRAKGESLDWGYVTEQLATLGLTDFEEKNRCLAVGIFAKSALTQEQQDILRFMADSGAFGTVGNYVHNQVVTYGFVGLLLRRLFPPLEHMASLYPILNSAPALLPAAWGWRLAKTLATKPGTALRQLQLMIVSGK